MLRIVSKLLAVVVSPVLALGIALPTASPAAATTFYAECSGIAPLDRGCTASGTFGPAGSSIIIGSGINVGYTGDLTIDVTSATGSYSWTLTFTGGVVTTDHGSTKTGTWYTNQSFTLSAFAPGTGFFDVYVYCDC